MLTPKVLDHLKKHGQLLDLEIANAIKIPLADVRAALSELSAQQEISMCSVTSFKNGKPVEAIQCRIFGYFPKPAPGRKPASKPVE
ncbi:MAG: transcriptional regulator [Rhodocyclaceae bacterium]|nr:transcriptional regulator [Dechloromonas sp.]MBP9655352.1 transcriptional regulator [Rhodocyclaceae bacterium]MBV2192162.1 transcriptional regulator [Azonexus sp.]HRF29920.1 transcriptional regulator [Azonexus sp.]